MPRALLLILLTVVAGCRNQHGRAIMPPAPNDNSYLDLSPGWRLRILVPILTDGNQVSLAGSTTEEGHTVALSAANLAGYEVSYYSAVAHRQNKIFLKFVSAERTKEGQTVPAPTAPTLPFQLPPKAAHIRLVFLLRVSTVDHNMAILAADDITSLDAFTANLKEGSAACQTSRDIFCSWVPERVAVRPQSPTEF